MTFGQKSLLSLRNIQPLSKKQFGEHLDSKRSGLDNLFERGREWDSPVTSRTSQHLHFVVLLQQVIDVNNTLAGKLDKVAWRVVVGGSLALETEAAFSTRSITEMTTWSFLVTFLLAPRPGAV